MILRVFSRKWLLTTVLVVIAMGVMIRLGFWQLDRLHQRRTFNARVLSQVDQPELTLTGDSLQADLVNMEYRKVAVQGEYDYSNEVALRNQVENNEWGVHLITPLRISGSDQLVFVDRGWIPAGIYNSGDWSQFHVKGEVEVRGIIRRSQEKPVFGRPDPTPIPGAPLQKAWNSVNIEAIDSQTDLDLLPVYIQEAPDPSWSGLPIRTAPDLQLSEGPHLGYALQWFAFALILGAGYPFFIRRQEKSKHHGIMVDQVGSVEQGAANERQ